MINPAAKRRTDFQRRREENAARHSHINIVSYQCQSAVWDRIRNLCNRKSCFNRTERYSYQTTPANCKPQPCATPPHHFSVHHIPDVATLVSESVTLQLCTVCSFNIRMDGCLSLICSYWFCSDYQHHIKIKHKHTNQYQPYHFMIQHRPAIEKRLNAERKCRINFGLCLCRLQSYLPAL